MHRWNLIQLIKSAKLMFYLEFRNSMKSIAYVRTSSTHTHSYTQFTAGWLSLDLDDPRMPRLYWILTFDVSSLGLAESSSIRIAANCWLSNPYVYANMNVHGRMLSHIQLDLHYINPNAVASVGNNYYVARAIFVCTRKYIWLVDTLFEFDPNLSFFAHSHS